MKIIYGTTRQIEPHFTPIGTYLEDEVEYYNGFELIQPYFFDEFELGNTPEIGCQYLLYLNEKEEVIGVLKWKRYTLPDHQFVTEEEAVPENSYNAIRLIDVRKDERNKGVAIALLHAFTERLHSNDYIVGGRATPQGRKTDIHKWVAREVKQTYYVSESELVDVWEEENCVW